MIPIPAETPLGASVGALAQVVGSRDLERRLHRVDVDKQGRIFLQFAQSDRNKWYRWNQGQLCEQVPEQDSCLPFVQSMQFQRDAMRELSYRPNRRLVAETSDGDGILKAYRKSRFEHGARCYEIAAAAAHGTMLRVPKVGACDSELAVIKIGIVSGDPLRFGPADDASFFQVGTGLRQLQHADRSEKLYRHSIGDELSLLEKLAQRVEYAVGLPERWSEAFQGMPAAGFTMHSSESTLCHRDFYDQQILVHEGQVGLVDFDTLCVADPLLDAGNFLAHLVLRSLQDERVRASNVGICGQAFLDGLDRYSDPEFWRRLRFFEAAAFLRLALIYWLRPRWRHLSGDCIQLASRCLSDLDSDREIAI